MAVPTLGFDARWAPVMQLLQQQQARPQDTDIDTYNNTNLPMWKRVGLQAPPQLLNGPQQSYANASNLQASNDGVSGQAGRMESSYNNSPYVANNGNTMGTIGNTGESRGAAQGSQGELVGKGGQGWNIYQTTPTWTGSPLSQSPPARDEGDFKAPPISGPQNPIMQRQQALRQLLIARAFQNMPRGYQFKLG